MPLQQAFKQPDLFVFGSGRSGTTLLSSILNASKQVFIPYESYFLVSAYPLYQAQTVFTEEDYQRIAQLFRKMTKRGWDMSNDYLVERLSDRQPQSFAEVNAVICEALHIKEETENLKWGIKAPVLISRLERVQHICPQAKLVHVVRDGRDVCLSYRKIHETSKIKFGPKGIAENALYWVDGLRHVEDFIERHPDQSVFELKYEDMVSAPSRYLSNLCDYLNIVYSPDMHSNFSLHEKNKKVVPAHFRSSFHQNLHKDLDGSNVNKYRSKMSVQQILLFELIAIPYLVKYGYTPEYPFLQSVLFAPLRSLLHFAARQFNNWRYQKRDRHMSHS